ncbi:hypothetical protein ACKXGD_17220, partial [Enterococcus lactis]
MALTFRRLSLQSSTSFGRVPDSKMACMVPQEAAVLIERHRLSDPARPVLQCPAMAHFKHFFHLFYKAYLRW